MPPNLLVRVARCILEYMRCEKWLGRVGCNMANQCSGTKGSREKFWIWI